MCAADRHAPRRRSKDGGCAGIVCGAIATMRRNSAAGLPAPGANKRCRFLPAPGRPAPASGMSRASARIIDAWRGRRPPLVVCSRAGDSPAAGPHTNERRRRVPGDPPPASMAATPAIAAKNYPNSVCSQTRRDGRAISERPGRHAACSGAGQSDTSPFRHALAGCRVRCEL